MLQDPLSTPAATGEIDRTGLGQTHTVTKATPLETPGPGTLRRDHKQGAGQPPQGATDGIQTQRHRRRSTFSIHLQGQHPAAGATGHDPQRRWQGITLARCRQGTTKLTRGVNAIPAEARMTCAIGTVPTIEQSPHALSALEGQLDRPHPGWRAIGPRLHIGQGIHRPGFLGPRAHTTIGGVIPGLNGLTIPLQHLT